MPGSTQLHTSLSWSVTSNSHHFQQQAEYLPLDVSLQTLKARQSQLFLSCCVTTTAVFFLFFIAFVQNSSSKCVVKHSGQSVLVFLPVEIYILVACSSWLIMVACLLCALDLFSCNKWWWTWWTLAGKVYSSCHLFMIMYDLTLASSKIAP